MNKKPLPTIGVDKYTFFKVNEDSVSGTEYGEAYNLKGTVEIAPTDSGGSDVFDADNGAYEASSYIEKLGHDITNADTVLTSFPTSKTVWLKSETMLKQYISVWHGEF